MDGQGHGHGHSRYILMPAASVTIADLLQSFHVDGKIYKRQSHIKRANLYDIFDGSILPELDK